MGKKLKKIEKKGSEKKIGSDTYTEAGPWFRSYTSVTILSKIQSRLAANLAILSRPGGKG
jgi:hypothetical protein